MADLNDLQSSGSVKIAGGNESYWADVSALNELASFDIIRNTILDFAISLGTSAVEVKSGGSRLVDRKSVIIYNNSNTTIYWGGSDVTTSNGTPINKGEFQSIRVGDVGVFIIASNTGLDIRCKELK